MPKAKSGKFVVRMEPLQHARLAKRADQHGMSLNSYVLDLLDRGGGFTPTASNGRKRAS